MVPLDRAFESDGPLEGQLENHPGRSESGLSEEVLADLRASPATFSNALRQIPKHADAVQRDLNRSVWNGSIRLSLHKNGSGAFAKALLRDPKVRRTIAKLSKLKEPPRNGRVITFLTPRKAE